MKHHGLPPPHLLHIIADQCWRLLSRPVSSAPLGNMSYGKWLGPTSDTESQIGARWKEAQQSVLIRALGDSMNLRAWEMVSFDCFFCLERIPPLLRPQSITNSRTWPHQIFLPHTSFTSIGSFPSVYKYAMNPQRRSCYWPHFSFHSLTHSNQAFILSIPVELVLSRSSDVTVSILSSQLIWPKNSMWHYCSFFLLDPPLPQLGF